MNLKEYRRLIRNRHHVHSNYLRKKPKKHFPLLLQMVATISLLGIVLELFEQKGQEIRRKLCSESNDSHAVKTFRICVKSMKTLGIPTGTRTIGVRQKFYDRFRLSAFSEFMFAKASYGKDVFGMVADKPLAMEQRELELDFLGYYQDFVTGVVSILDRWYTNPTHGDRLTPILLFTKVTTDKFADFVNYMGDCSRMPVDDENPAQDALGQIRSNVAEGATELRKTRMSGGEGTRETHRNFNKKRRTSDSERCVIQLDNDCVRQGSVPDLA